MARNRFSLGNMAREDDEVNADLTPEQGEAAVDEIVESPAEDIAEADQLAGELDEIVDGIGEVVGDAEELEGVADAIDATKAEGGVSAPAAEALNLMLNIVAKRHGIPLTGSFSRESFDSKTSRVKATEGLVDRVKDTAKTIWKWLQKAYEKAKAWVIKWFNKFFDGATKLKDRAEKLEKLAKSKSGKSYTGTDKINNDSVAEGLADEKGNIPTGPELAQHFRLNSDGLKTGRADDMSAKFAEKALTLTDNVEKEAQFKAAMQALYTELSAGTKISMKDDEDSEYRLQQKCLGGKAVVCRFNKDAGADVEEQASAIGSSRIVVGLMADAKTPKSLELPVLSGADCTVLAGNVKELATVLVNSKDRVKKFETSADKLIAAAKRQESRIGAKEDSDDSVERSKQARTALSGIAGAVASIVVVLRQTAMTEGNLALNYVAASLKMLGAKEEKKNKDDIS